MTKPKKAWLAIPGEWVFQGVPLMETLWGVVIDDAYHNWHPYHYCMDFLMRCGNGSTWDKLERLWFAD
jgi:hypothetical protein